MSAPLLATKLFIPGLRGNQVARTHLLLQLMNGLAQGRRLTLISAPAGYGKTTLVGEWIQQAGLPAAWISLDEGDNDIVRFSKYLIAALQTILPGIGASALFILEASQTRGVEEMLTGLINELSAEGLPNFLLVFDDYHQINSQAVHDAVAFLIEHLPPQAHLVIATRADPPLPVARLRGRGQVTELRLVDLRFTPQESAQFLEILLGERLSVENINALNARTEGWAAGLQMAALALQATGEHLPPHAIEDFIHGFAGGNRYVLDYLLEEVMQRQPGHIQAFLAQTSILERLCGGLCDAVTGQAGASQAILESLEHANLFILPLDDRRHWYRYHRLFADLLQQRLLQAPNGAMAELHLRASCWFEQNGFPAEAVDHALAGGDLDRAGALIEQVAENMAMRSEILTLLRWIDQLPEADRRGRPKLGLFQAWGLLLSGQPLSAVERRLDTLEGAADWLIPRAAPIRSYMALMQGQAALCTGQARLALENLPDDEPFLRSLAVFCLAIAAMAEYQTKESLRLYEEAVRVSREVGNILVAVIVLYSLADLYHKQGQLFKSQAMCLEALELATDAQDRLLPIAVRPLAGLGDLKREWNDLPEAARLLDQAIDLHRAWLGVGAVPALLARSRARLAQQDIDGAQQDIDQARRLAAQTPSTELDDLMVELIQAWMWIQLGRLDLADGWARARGLEAISEAEFLAEASTLSGARLVKYEYLVLARLYLAKGQPDQALRLMDRVEPFFVKVGRRGTLLEVSLLRALALQALGQEEAARTKLTQALDQAEPEGYVRLFVDEGEPLRRLLEECQEHLARTAPVTRLLPYLDRLLQAFPTGPSTIVRPPVGATRKSAALVEALSERELEVLRLLQSPLSAEQIAERLVISVHTARSHIKSIYAKLGVHGRMEAVERARELAIL